jgi:triacylglycerol esterase/lipase EstA (alpha/beta hydrolase family)
MLSRRAAALLLAVAAAAALTPAASARQRDPRLKVPAAELRQALECPGGFAHRARNPVLLVHGTGTNPEDSWSWNYARTLPELGYDACTVRLPDDALGDIQVGSEYVVYAIRRMRRASGRKLTVIGHSQGGLEPRWAIRWWPRSVRPRVEDYIGLASPNHGVRDADTCAGSGDCWPAVWQMASRSRFLAALNSVDETPRGVSYTSIYSESDELVQPVGTSDLQGGSNIRIQAICPGRPVHHVGLVHEAVTFELVMDAMTHPGPASPQRIDRSACARGNMPGVSAADAAAGNSALYGNAARAFSEHPGVSEEPRLRRYARR